MYTVQITGYLRVGYLYLYFALRGSINDVFKICRYFDRHPHPYPHLELIYTIKFTQPPIPVRFSMTPLPPLMRTSYLEAPHQGGAGGLQHTYTQFRASVTTIILALVRCMLQATSAINIPIRFRNSGGRYY